MVDLYVWPSIEMGLEVVLPEKNNREVLMQRIRKTFKVQSSNERSLDVSKHKISDVKF